MSNWLKTSFGFFKRVWQGLKMLPRIRSQHLPQIFESITKKDLAALVGFVLIFLSAGGFLVRAYFYSGNSNIPDYGGEHIEGLIGQPRFINPVLAASSSVDSDLTKLLYAQILKMDEQGNLVPDLAEGLPQISPDQKTYTIKLKPNLKWQDDTPINADDIVYTIQTIQNPDYESPLNANWSRVRVEKIDDLTIKFTLHQVSNAFTNNFMIGILPKHVWGDLAPNNFRLADQNLRPVGSGPYSVREIKKTTDGTIKSITLRSSSSYHNGAPYITYFTFKFYSDEQALLSAYQSKDIQTLGFIPFDNKIFLENSDRNTQYQISLPQYQAVFFNVAKSQVVNEKALRQALWLATDRDSIIQDVYLGLAKPAYSPILPGNLGYNPREQDVTHISLSESKTILDKAGWILDPQTNTRYKMVTTGTGANKIQTRKNLEFNLATNVSPLNVKTAQILEKQWAEIGVTVRLVIVSAADLQDDYIRTRNFDALLFSENTGADPDPFPFWHSSQSHDPGLNLSGFSNATVDKLLTDARQTTDKSVRTKNYMQFQDIITQEIPAIFLNSAVYVYTVPKKERGFELSNMVLPSERFMNVDKWYIDTRRK
jgi:peptide/nickel transport system substrate-binding protein